jgi:parvulin-like peptidyl-prolyl isomerase
MIKLLALILIVPGLALSAAEKLFDDPVIAKGKGVEVRQSQLDEAFVLLKANRATAGEPLSPLAEPKIRRQILDKMIATQLLIGKATPSDRDEGKKFADKYVEEMKGRAPSEASFKRQLRALGSSYEQYQADVLEQAITKTVIDRELKNREIVTDQDIKKFYDENPELFEEAEEARVRQILFATRKIPTGEDLGPGVRREKRAAAEKVLQRAKAGEDFAKLAREYSDDPQSKEKGGELKYTKGTRSVPPEFEAAVSSVAVGGLTDIVETVFGFHIIKVEEKTPPKRLSIDKVQDKIKEAILQARVQKKLPDYVEELRKKAEVTVNYDE